MQVQNSLPSQKNSLILSASPATIHDDQYFKKVSTIEEKLKNDPTMQGAKEDLIQEIIDKEKSQKLSGKKVYIKVPVRN